MRKVKVLTAFLTAILAVGSSGLLLRPATVNSVTVQVGSAVYNEELTVTTVASIETTAATTTTTTTTEETTTTTEETTAVEETTTTEETTTSAETTPAPETAPAETAPQTQPTEPVIQAMAPQTEPAVTEADAVQTAAETALTTAETEAAPSRAITVTDAEYIMLCNVVGHEYGANWVSEYDKALVVEVIMNRVNSPLFPNTIYSVLTQRNQFSGLSYYINLGTFSYQVTDSVKAAVDLYLSDPSQFNHGYLYFSGDGYRNYFRTSY